MWKDEIHEWPRREAVRSGERIAFGRRQNEHMSRKTKREENETSVNVGQSMTAMAKRGEKVARKRAGRQNE